MADERAQLTGEPQPIPACHRWADLAAPQMEGVELEQQYRETLCVLGLQGGMLGLIFEMAQNKIQDPAKLRQLVVEPIGEEHWTARSADGPDSFGPGRFPLTVVPVLAYSHGPTDANRRETRVIRLA